MIKVQSYVMLILPNVIMESSNVKKIIIIREPLNVIKIKLYVILVLPNVTMEPSNVKKKKKKKKGTIECEKREVTCDVGTV